VSKNNKHWPSSLYLWYWFRYIFRPNTIIYLISTQPVNKRIVYVVRDFRTWDVITKVHYFWWFKFIIWGLKRLNTHVEHDLETCQRPWSTTSILTLWASQRHENWKWSIKNQNFEKNNVLLSLRPMDKNPGRHEQVQKFNLIRNFRA
jgi:hypothetical protein